MPYCTSSSASREPSISSIRALMCSASSRAPFVNRDVVMKTPRSPCLESSAPAKPCMAGLSTGVSV